jgi:hypothetical protein
MVGHSHNTRRFLQSALLFALLSLTACGGGETPAPATALMSSTVPVMTSMGTDFYLTLPDHLCVSNPSLCDNAPVTNKMIVAAATATTGNVTFNSVTIPFTIDAGGEKEIPLDPEVVLTSNETVETKGIHVTSISPVSVHVVSESATSADGYLALPTPGLGTNYYVMSYASGNHAGSEFAVVATQNNTTVTITPTADGATQKAGVTFTVSLNTGETYQLQNQAFADMTGTYVTADKPIAVFGGHLCTDVPSGVDSCDYLVEQLPDVSIWGKTFHTSLFSASPIGGRTGYTVRVIASQNGTTFATIPPGLIPGTLNAGQFAEVELTVAAEFVSNNPVLMAQFMRGNTDDAAGKGDPSMVIVTPAELGTTNATFGVHGLAGTTQDYMNVTTETAALGTLKLDNVVVDATRFIPIGGTSIYSVGMLPVAPEGATGVAHTLVGTAPFSALVYDFGIPLNAVSYAYPVATNLSLPAAAPPVNPAATGCEDDLRDEDQHSVDSPDYTGQLQHGTQPHQTADHDDDGHECN